MFIVIIAAGIIPMVIYPLFLYWMDRYEKEPIGLLVATFFWGFFPAAILSLIVQLIFGATAMVFDQTGQTGDLLTTVFIAPVTEELFKGLAILLIFIIWKNEFDGVFDGIIYGGLVGFGFAAIENILYFWQYGLDLFFLRAILFGLNHALFTSLTGIGFGISRHARHAIWRYMAPLLGIIVAIVVHAVHNAGATFTTETTPLICMSFLVDWGGVFFLFVVMLIAIRRERQWITDQLRDEIEIGTLTAQQYAIACSPLKRLGVQARSLMKDGPTGWFQTHSYFDTLTELAFKKHAYNRRGEAGAKQSLIKNLRDKASNLSTKLTDTVL